MKFPCSLFTLILLGFAATSTFAADAGLGKFRPGELWPDDKGVPINAHGGGILLHEGVYYWFGEHKIEGDAGNVAQVGVHVYSSRDLVHWRDTGIALPVSDDPKSEIVKGCIVERPKVYAIKEELATRRLLTYEGLPPIIRSNYQTLRPRLSCLPVRQIAGGGAHFSIPLS